MPEFSTPQTAETCSSFRVRKLAGTAVIIPTYNAQSWLPAMRRALEMEEVPGSQVLVIDSTSTDDTCALARAAGYVVVQIPKSSFNHGATRQLASTYVRWADKLLFLTQDAIPRGNGSLARLVEAFENPLVGAAYGRQLPRESASSIEVHARRYNYPACSDLRTFESSRTLGFRAAYFSNSFAAYRRSAFEEVGGFPTDVIVSEDVSVVARILLEGWSVAYCAEAEVVHSHLFDLRGEFSRYFDIAVHHSREQWIMEQFGEVGGEGLHFMLSEMLYLLRADPHLLPISLVRNFLKWTGYRFGRHERHLPLWLKRRVSGQKAYWNQQSEINRLSYAPVPYNLPEPHFFTKD